MSKTDNQKMVPVSIEDEMKYSYLDYAMSVIVSRAIPDVRDGLKPVHRRILYAMYEGGNHNNKPYRKSARIVGDVMGKYHPHGDSAIYDSLVRMAQDFSLRLMLVDGQGNFGSMDGDSPAAMRYTESRLAKVAHRLVENIDQETVDFIENYDGSELEPVVLPAMFPNILVNGSNGIAVGMATNIPPHNLNEVIEACCLYLDNNDLDISELLSVVHGPDFPTGGIILGTDSIKSAYSTGRGSIIIRGKTVVEEVNNKQAIIITEIPYMVNKARLVEKIAELVKEKRIEGIIDLRDESSKSGIRIVIELKKDTFPEVILNQLFIYTQLQTTFGIIMLALVDGLPKVMNLKELIAAFINFREIVITRRTIFLLKKAQDKAHILLGLTTAVRHIDEIIQIIKSSNNSIIAKERIISRAWDCEDIINFIILLGDKKQVFGDSKYHLSEVQAKAILEMRLHRLTGMELDKLKNDLDQIIKEIYEFNEILGSRKKLLEILKNELLKVKNEFGTERLTNIINENFEHDIEDLIQREEMVVTVTLTGYIKRVPLTTYKSQKRGGKGRSGLSMREEDITTQVFVGSTHTPMLFFSNLGQVYSLKLYKLPIGNPNSKGRPIINILPIKNGERITNIMPLPENEEDWDNLNIIFATSRGNIRRNDLSDFKRIQSNGKIAIRLESNDHLIDVKVCKSDDHVLLATKLGKAIRFPVNLLRVFKSRTSDGVKGMNISPNDQVISMTILKGIVTTIEEREEYLSIPLEKRLDIVTKQDVDPKDLINIKLSKEKILELAFSEEFILTVAENGFGKRTSAYEYRITNRGGRGVVNINVSDKTGLVVAVMPVAITDELMIITDNGKLIRCKLNSLRITGRNTQGVILFKTELKEKVVSASLIVDGSDKMLLDKENLEESV